MALAQTLKAHLERHGVAWRTLRHPATASSHDTAAVAHVPEDHIAKAVVVRDERGPAMVVIPASHWLRLETLNAKLDRGFGLADESGLDRLFPDCAAGAIPPVGPAYGLETFVDENLASLARVFLEAGDHEALIEVSGEDFLRLQDGARRDYYSHDGTT
ncbi:uncharacterized protein FOKN1_2445 [Thiohalobacter thiocyanaticus]|uniref:YbaK/aminoacyl-tRNA synthetase-associated domain-containing protein n=1 Tax=Thiohalobacter thiocyanaticus TaxID=585455 RepID=A0A1Z4VT50_9GAMM|nr:YbaK/EbsC family protein [Thiohalobacter thiocyanaticus]BAZ94817.1 uncharacterized protein FOKN1_2445 [Thiohalobacter thiocyanaticus]